ncbi:hypothetical protein THARTR1_05898 [Trichoderma harzianum]|uniref:SWIM-type domain-containing protein n=1 Tax=Trichoderma harzianum TaxID=5544 RepID=A0A2K0U7P0_TRIHA|nr:hypothetical protein THARTR1_05898 [Trichoderma harzianum]
MSVPVAPFSRLTLDEMSPTSQSGPHAALQGDIYEPTIEDSSSDLESCSDSEDDGDELSMVVQSPTKLAYNINHLPEKAQGAVREIFSEPPTIALQQCRLIDDTYAFQMTELVTQSIRIRASCDGSSQLTCSCRRGDEAEPCSHLLWLMDRLTKQMLYDYDPKTPLTMTQDGFAEELGDPFTAISEHHLDVLSDGLHCQVIDPEALSEDDLASYRVQESRELLAAVYGKTPEDFRPDIFARPVLGKKVLKRNDLDCTVFRMLLDNHHFFNYFQSVSRPRDPINDPFRKLVQRVDRVLRRFDAYASDPAPARSSAETLPNVAWAAKHLLGCIKLIKSIIYTRDRPLQPSEAASAARTLVRILSAVVSRNHDVVSSGSPAETPRTERNLYLHLIGDKDRGFVLAELNLLPEAASQHLHTLEALLEDIGMHGAPMTFSDKFKALLVRLRAPKRSSSLKRQGDDEGGSSRGSKRMK